MDVAVVWFRRDLRLEDHPALVEATRIATTVLPLFVLDDRLLQNSAPARTWFLRGSLAELDRSLRARGSGLIVRHGDPEIVVAEVARQAGADMVLTSRDVTPYSRRRDTAVGAMLARDGRRLIACEGLLLAEPETIRTSEGRPYGVFTPFWRALERTPRRTPLWAPTAIPTPQRLIPASAVEDPGPAPLPTLPAPGEEAAQERLERWVAGGLSGYGRDRDGLGGEGTSHLGADLHFGTLSPLQVEMAARESGAEALPFTRQLAWRELYQHQLYHHGLEPPRPSPLEAAFRREADDPAAVAAWRDGRTGVPAVDAAMRQLLATGWMSNRARLVVASFLTRHLLIDHRVGERHFLRHLIDGDVANNRGGWEWTAGVGLDAQPWFRIFNPVRQGLRFDPEGSWVRRWVPELAGVPDRFVHAPWDAPSPPADYPAPIVDLADGRARALATFKAATRRD